MNKKLWFPETSLGELEVNIEIYKAMMEQVDINISVQTIYIPRDKWRILRETIPIKKAEPVDDGLGVSIINWDGIPVIITNGEEIELDTSEGHMTLKEYNKRIKV